MGLEWVFCACETLYALQEVPEFDCRVPSGLAWMPSDLKSVGKPALALIVELDMKTEIYSMNPAKKVAIVSLKQNIQNYARHNILGKHISF